MTIGSVIGSGLVLWAVLIVWVLVMAWWRGELDELVEDDGSEWDVRRSLDERDEW